MSDMVRIKKSTLDGIAHAIQEQEGSTAQIQAKEMENRIRTLTGGAVEHTTGTVTFANNYQAKTISHGMSKKPKLFFLRWNEYATTVSLYLCSALYTEQMSAVCCTSGETVSFSAQYITVPGIYTPGYGAMSADDINVYITETARSWKAGDYTWEAWTW